MKIYRNKHSDTDRLQKVACRMITRRGCIPENQKVVVTSAKRTNGQIPSSIGYSHDEASLSVKYIILFSRSESGTASRLACSAACCTRKSLACLLFMREL